MIKITHSLLFDESEVEYQFIRSPGPGGQNVNKVATGVLLRFNVKVSASLSEDIKTRLVKIAGTKLSTDGELVIKATRCRTQNRNKQDALKRLCHLLKIAATPPKKRRATKPTKTSIEKRLDSKKKLGKIKSMRRKPIAD